MKPCAYTKDSPRTIQKLFSSIAPSYDRANAVLSFGLHKVWNRALIDALYGDVLLDLCAGTGDIALGYLKKNLSAHAVLLDFCPEMLALADAKGLPFKGRFQTIAGDAQAIPLGDASVDAVSVAYGIRNVKEHKKCFHEVYRVLKPGGCFGILELTRPRNFCLRLGHKLYLKTLLPPLGRLIAHNKQAYGYLSRSIGLFLSPQALTQELIACGFRIRHEKALLGGTATLIVGEKCASS